MLRLLKQTFDSCHVYGECVWAWTWSSPPHWNVGFYSSDEPKAAFSSPSPWQHSHELQGPPSPFPSCRRHSFVIAKTGIFKRPVRWNIHLPPLIPCSSLFWEHHKAMFTSAAQSNSSTLRCFAQVTLLDQKAPKPPAQWLLGLFQVDTRLNTTCP